MRVRSGSRVSRHRRRAAARASASTRLAPSPKPAQVASKRASSRSCSHCPASWSRPASWPGPVASSSPAGQSASPGGPADAGGAPRLPGRRRRGPDGGGARVDVRAPARERGGHVGQHRGQGVGIEIGSASQEIAVRGEKRGGRPPVEAVPRADVGAPLGVDPHRQEPVGHKTHDARIAIAEPIHLRRPPAPRGADEQEDRFLLRRGAGEGVGSPCEPGDRFRRRHHAVRTTPPKSRSETSDPGPTQSGTAADGP